MGPQQGMAASRPPGRDAGFTLIETVLGLVLFALILASALPLLVGTFQGSAGLGSKEAAITLAGQRLEYVRSIAPANLLKGRYYADVNALTGAPGLVNLGNDLIGAGNSDPSATSGSAAAVVPLTSTQAVGGTTYTIRTYIDACYLSGVTGVCTADTSNGSLAYRVSVDVTWPLRSGVQCTSGRAGQCEYVVTTLVDPSKDPVFNLYGTPTISSLGDATTLPVTALGAVHPGQRLTLQVTGTNFASGATATSSGGDQLGAVTTGSATSLTVPFQASSTLGVRTFAVVNPNGASGSTTLSVTKSAPTLTALAPSSAPRNAATTFTLTGTDFFATPSLSTQSTVPTVSITGSTSIFGLPLTVSVSNVTVVSRTSVTFRTTLPYWIFSYSATGTVTLTNPDAGSATLSFSVNAT